jgi:NAD(P) transhydrogenase subunit alpha
MISLTRRITAGVLFLLAIILAAGSWGQDGPADEPAADPVTTVPSESSAPVAGETRSAESSATAATENDTAAAAPSPAADEPSEAATSSTPAVSTTEPAAAAPPATATEPTAGNPRAEQPATPGMPSQSDAQPTNAAESVAPAPMRQGLVASLTIFVLAIFIGFEVITKVPPTLHTPLMSGSNAISGVTVVGAVIVAAAMVEQLSPLANQVARGLGFLAVVLATINVVGGFMVTHRMLSMFKRK